jgi:hydrogenase maturation protease
MTEHVLVVGCGNEQAGDDGAGAALIRRLMRRPPPGCTLCMCRPLDLLELLDSANSIVFVDAVVSGAAVPGTIHLTPLPSQGVQGKLVGGLSAHGWSVVEAIDLARALRRRVPSMFLIGIEADAMMPGTTLSPAVQRAVDYCEAHFDELRRRAERGERAIVASNAVPV